MPITNTSTARPVDANANPPTASLVISQINQLAPVNASQPRAQMEPGTSTCAVAYD